MLGVSRENIKDTFSEVTFALEAISYDLGQERVALVTSDGVEHDAKSGQEGDGEGKMAPQVSNIDSIMPFKVIQRQIDSNYEEI